MKVWNLTYDDCSELDGVFSSREKAKKSKGIKKKPDYSTIQIVSTKEEDN